MSRLKTLVAATSATAVITGMMTAGLSGLAQASPTPPVTLPGSAAPFTAHTPTTGDLATSQRLSVELWLKPNLTAAQRFATATSTPGSSAFRHYLNPAAYTTRFGPTRSQAAAVASWLRSQGFTGVSTSAQRDYVRATAPVSKVNAAFHVTMKLYKASKQVNAGPYRLFANDRPVSLPASLAGGVLGVTGLDNAAPTLPLQRPGTVPAGVHGSRTATSAAVPCSQYYGQNMASGLPEKFGTTSFPTEGCGYSAAQLRRAYGANMTNTGKGVTVALIELGLASNMFQTLKDYANANKMPAPSTARYEELSLGRGSACGDPFATEEQLDVEAAYDMAPAANQLVVGGDSCDTGDYGLQGLLNADTTVINGNGGHPLAAVASNSWEASYEGQPVITEIMHAFLVKAASVGVGMYFSSGDFTGLEAPSDDPFAIAVGGTTLGLGKTSGRLFETGWSSGLYQLQNNAWTMLGDFLAGGGGPSLIWAEPSYQKGVVPKSMTTAPGDSNGPARSAPDISADADPFTGMLIGILVKGVFTQFDVGGTSESAPLVAGMVAAAQQGQAKPFGFLNPAFYKLAGTGAFNDTLPLTSASPTLWRAVACLSGPSCFGLKLLGQNDAQFRALPGWNGQVTAKGYDNMTGVGTPNGQAFITALRTMK